MHFLVFVVALFLGAAKSQFFQPVVTSPFGFGQVQPNFVQTIPVQQPKPVIQHRAVVLNAEMESHLPQNLKNPFYRDPRIEAALAKESWFTPGEQQVKEREAEKIPRMKIFSILRNAGFARR